MSVSTQGLRVKSSSQALRSAVELLSSMRFSISLLTIICIASVIGTVLQQEEPFSNYVNQFGPFWAEVFGALGLYAVYSAWWFLLILAFLVTSTSLCIARNTPKILADLKTFKEDIREQSLQAFGHRAQAELNERPQAAAERVRGTLAGAGWRVKVQQRPNGWMVAAKKGSINKLGYIAAHSAIVLICLGGLVDGNLGLRAQMWFGGKTPYVGGGLISDVKPQHRLSPSNPAFRGNLLVAEGQTAGTAILNQPKGVVLQDLPFTIELKKFIVEYYSTGMPKLFASDVVLRDNATGRTKTARVEVNHPVSFDGVEIFQSSFDDGGSSVQLQAVPMNGTAKPFVVDGTIGGSTQLARAEGGQPLTLEFAGLRVINVENFGDDAAARGGADVRRVNLRQAIDKRLGAADRLTSDKALRNVGPSVSYRLRDASGQAREFNNYMLPVDMGDGVPVFLLGVRDAPDAPYRYLRIPADDQNGIEGFVRLRAALADPKLRQQAAERYAAAAVSSDKPALVQQLAVSAERALGLFAGASVAANDGVARPTGGLQAISNFIESDVPQADRQRAGEVLVRILDGTLFQLEQIARSQAGQPPLEPSERTQKFMMQAVLALSDAQFYPSPLAFELKDFRQVQASVFQVARAPGKNIVYLGCVLLILGVFSMLYVRERRVWVWIRPQDGRAHATMALSMNRKTLDGEREFEQLKHNLIGAKD
ncbi:MAG: Cytochrome c-type biogenesis protein Ccs1/ResB [Burkholderiaceae bacterium]|jgi:cytochrome c biogenesis protein|nr:MAG: Cytochrome c-type biogenesis protein Ccs1/ResB [Burkholderiaceae bacterium]